MELGAGATGLPGIVAAQLGCFSQVAIKLSKPFVAILSSSLWCHCASGALVLFRTMHAQEVPEFNEEQDGLPGMRTEPVHRYTNLTASLQAIHSYAADFCLCRLSSQM